MNSKPTFRTPLAILRRLLVTAPQATPVDLRGKTAIVTGTAIGSIGYQTAKILARWGATVVVTSRKQPELLAQGIREELEREGITAAVNAHALDLAEAGSVAQFANWYRDTYGDQLHLLINNAGIHLDLLSQWKSPHLTADGHELHWRTNYLGTMHLTHLLLPLLQKTGRSSGDARVINVVSQLHSKGINADLFAPSTSYNSWVAYATSKLALVHASKEMQRRYASSDHVQAYCLHPGAVFTNIADKGLSGNPLLESIRRALSPIERFFLMTPEEGAQTQVHCATAPRLEGGHYFTQCRIAESSPASRDSAAALRLWDNTSAWLETLR